MDHLSPWGLKLQWITVGETNSKEFKWVVFGEPRDGKIGNDGGRSLINRDSLAF